jgi:hypothetical protein
LHRALYATLNNPLQPLCSANKATRNLLLEVFAASLIASAGRRSADQLLCFLDAQQHTPLGFKFNFSNASKLIKFVATLEF